ncbi:hypothetical protein GF402_01555 [Candidatus Fermentibacteria bacterium]|nr:hypothetical protein [Candidatus Fermentibacteria bacterium]
MDDEGYLWASDNDNQKIYQIDLDAPGIVENTSVGIAGEALRLSSNPFRGSLTITPTGFGAVVNLTIYDSTGRVVRTAQVDGPFLWNGTTDSGAPLPAGVYTVAASTKGSESIARAVLLR